MKQYVGTVYVGAEPMDLGSYNKYRGWDIPKDEDPKREGYLVVHPGGHETWAPKEQFDEVYKEVQNG